MTRKGYDRVPRPLCVSGWHHLPFCLQNKIWLKWKGWPLWAVSASAHATTDMLMDAYAPNSGGPRAQCGRLVTLKVTQGKRGTEATRGTAASLVVCVTSVHTYAPRSHQMSLTKHRFKDKIIKKYQNGRSRALYQQGVLPNKGCPPRKPALW